MPSLMALTVGNRVRYTKLPDDGEGTVTNLRGDGFVSVMLDDVSKEIIINENYLEKLPG
jgi:hypothetical protein